MIVNMKNKIICIIAFMAILLAAGMSFPSVLNADTEAETHYENAKKLFYEKDLCEAEIELRKALTEDPYNQEAIDLFKSIEVIRELERQQIIEEIVVEEIASSNDIIISVAENKIRISIPAGALEGIEEAGQIVTITASNNADREEIEDEFLKSGIRVRAEGEHAVFREIEEGTKNPIREYVLGSDLYIFDLEEKNGTEDFKFQQDIEITLEFDWELINPTLAYWDETPGEWVTMDDTIIDCNHLTASFDDIKDKKLCVLGDISNQVREDIVPETGGLLEYRSDNIKRAELNVPEGAVDNDILISLTEVYRRDYMEEVCTREGYRIDGKIYDLRSRHTGQSTDGLIDYGAFTSPFLKPVVITLECSIDSICPKIAYFVCDECCVGWEIVPTKRINESYVRAYIYHLSKWAVLESISEDIAEARIDDEEIIESTTDEKITGNGFIQFFINIWDFIKQLFVQASDE